ncbi:AFL186Wp [Eremothecium gossypii ATCC 10895]|uniref:Autophagy protein 16 n=2 Tax=Eremothecium gossypii (strain ATCC 10895 / CBS 109.51 / FGSC 9923 / NRRL Y-1056) TaxID=284811 RepID=ATG16_EREGS|nr:AFL186Wp [Eremothecium gossypii ATCC 10895]Q755K3.1 RecName: Full=Autophagy protein 16 [Eremothecium gossypii ATCC 10895]AAS53188.1 AFL186Wp [Eremothecium gossypii ATCC 10895]AEY97498.1 FAFL186Wp [Eremothecium gossypii FDAG1]
MDLHQLYLDRLRQRDRIEGNFCYLFEAAVVLETAQPPQDSRDLVAKSLREELHAHEQEIHKLKDIVHLRSKDAEKLNDEIISLNIENSLLQDKLTALQAEYDKLIQRWLAKAQSEADAMNQGLA